MAFVFPVVWSSSPVVAFSSVEKVSVSVGHGARKSRLCVSMPELRRMGMQMGMGAASSGEQESDEKTGSRASEFDVVVAPGDKRVQDQLADAVTWEAEKLHYGEFLDFFVRAEMHKFRERLHQQNQLHAEKFRLKSDHIALLETCVHTSRWNQEQITMDKETRERRAKIQAELSVIDALLRREQMRSEMKRQAIKMRRGKASSTGSYRSSSSKDSSAVHSSKPMRALSRAELSIVALLSAACTALGQHELAQAVESIGAESFESWALYLMGFTMSYAYLVAVSDYRRSRL